MSRYLALFLPNFSIWRAQRLRPDGPEILVLVTEARGTQHVAERSRAAAKLGVRRGMSVSHARALVGSCASEWLPFDPETDRVGLRDLGLDAMSFSPRVAVDGDDGLVFDIAGTERLFGGERELLSAVLEEFGELGLHPRGAVADTLGCAWARARFGEEAGRGECVTAGLESEALAPLPVSALRIGAEIEEALAEVNIDKVAELFELPRDQLPARFGSDLLLRLDQALGHAFEDFLPLEYTDPLRVERVFDEPVGLEPVLHVLPTLLGDLLVELRARDQGVRRLELVLTCADSVPVRETVVLSGPSREAEHLLSLMEPRIARAQLGFGVLEMELFVAGTGEIDPVQATAFEVSEERRALERASSELIDVLVGRLGRDAVLGLEGVESHVPERAFRTRPCVDTRSLFGDAGEGDRVTPHARPSRLLAEPEEAHVLATRGTRPTDFLWRGESRGVIRFQGPERIEPPWWSADVGVARDFYRVEDDRGGWLWMSCDRRGSWSVHGEWA